jgi:hypothetical protein
VGATERERISSLVWFAVGIGICIGSVRFSLGNLHKPGPGFFPFLAGSILGALALVLFFQSFKKPTRGENKDFWINPKRRSKVIYVIGALFFYFVAISYMGFFISTLIFTGFILRAIAPQRWIVVISVSILSTLLSYGIFKCWLGVPLPEGIFGM